MKKATSIVLMLLLVAAAVFAGATEEKQASSQANKDLKVLLTYVNYDPNEDYSAKATEQLTGYHAVYSSLPMSDAASKLSAILASKEDYDVMILSYDLFSKTVGLGAYQPLNNYLNEYGKDLLSVTSKSLWTNTTIDGKIMGVPFRLSNENYTMGHRVRTDLLAKAGITTLPTTLDELYTTLKTVKDRLGIIPMTGNSAIIDEVSSAFGIYNAWNVTPEGIRNRVTTPGAREYVTYMHKLYVEGLIDNEWAQNTASTMQEKFFSGKALIYQVFWWNEPSATQTMLANFPDATFSYLPPLKNSEGESGMPINRGTDNVVVIPAVSNKAEESIQWMNSKVASPETFRQLCIGIEGVHYNVIRDNEYQPIQPAFSTDMNNANVFLTGTDTDQYGIFWAQTRVRKNELLFQEFTKMQENVEEATIYYDPTTFMAPNSEFTALAPSVNSYVNDTMLQMIVGTRSIDEWDKFISEYYEMGGDKLEAIINEWWDANKTVVKPMTKR